MSQIMGVFIGGITFLWLARWAWRRTQVDGSRLTLYVRTADLSVLKSNHDFLLPLDSYVADDLLQSEVLGNGTSEQVQPAPRWLPAVVYLERAAMMCWSTTVPSPEPVWTLRRRGLRVQGRVTPDRDSGQGLPLAHVVVECHYHGHELWLGVAESHASTLTAWVEAAPPSESEMVFRAARKETRAELFRIPDSLRNRSSY